MKRPHVQGTAEEKPLVKEGYYRLSDSAEKAGQVVRCRWNDAFFRGDKRVQYAKHATRTMYLAIERGQVEYVGKEVPEGYAVRDADPKVGLESLNDRIVESGELGEPVVDEHGPTRTDTDKTTEGSEGPKIENEIENEDGREIVLVRMKGDAEKDRRVLPRSAVKCGKASFVISDPAGGTEYLRKRDGWEEAAESLE